MDNVIEQSRLKNHTVKRYRFKVLGSAKHEDDVSDELEKVSDVVSDDGNTTQADVPNGNQNQFVEELLKRSDTLSSNIIKLQMQIEKQEKEFENRLKESVAREREIAFNEGYEKAKKELEASFDERVANYIESARKLNQKSGEIDEFFTKMENSLIETSLEVAKEVINREISTYSSKIAASLAKELVEELKDASEITLKVNPKDFDTLNEIFSANSKVRVQSDSAISLGGVILLSDKGNLDGSISARLEKIKYILESKN